MVLITAAVEVSAVPHKVLKLTPKPLVLGQMQLLFQTTWTNLLNKDIDDLFVSLC